MELDGFEWDSGNVAKCGTHGVSGAEIQSLFAAEPLIGPGPWPSERRYRAFGKTEAGRGVFVVFTWRTRHARQLIRPISARYMHKKKTERYDEEIS